MTEKKNIKFPEQIDCSEHGSEQFNLDLTNNSAAKTAIPGNSIRQLPVYLLDCGVFYTGKDYFTKRTHADMFLVIFTILGSGKVSFDGREYDVGENSAIFINCNNPHDYATNGDHWDFFWAQFSGYSANTYFQLIKSTSETACAIADSLEMKAYFTKLLEYTGKKDLTYSVKTTSILIQILTSIFNNSFSINNKENLEADSGISKVIEYIENNYMKEISLDDLCVISHFSKYHFSRTFKHCTGSSPYEYLSNVRMNHAKVMLTTTDYSIDKIARLVGLADDKALIRKFKALTGLTPNIYRKYLPMP